MRFPCFIPLVVLIAGSASVFAQDADTVKKTAFNQFDAARKIAEIVKQIAPNSKSINVREFRGRGFQDLGLTKLVGDELEKMKFAVDSAAATELEGRLERVPSKVSDKATGVRISGRVIMPSGAEREYETMLQSADDAASLASETGDVGKPPVQNADPVAANSPVVSGTRILSSQNSPYSVEIFQQTKGGDYAAVTPVVRSTEDGRKVVEIELGLGAIYAVRLYNQTDFEAAVNLRVDGLSRFALADDESLRNLADIALPKNHRDLLGWFRTLQSVDTFKIGEYSESPAAKKLPASNKDSGTLTVAVSAAWKEGENPPPNEPTKNKNFTPGTVQGPPMKDPTETVKREFGAVRSVFKIRYKVQAPPAQ